MHRTRRSSDQDYKKYADLRHYQISNNCDVPKFVNTISSLMKFNINIQFLLLLHLNSDVVMSRTNGFSILNVNIRLTNKKCSIITTSTSFYYNVFHSDLFERGITTLYQRPNRNNGLYLINNEDVSHILRGKEEQKKSLDLKRLTENRSENQRNKRLDSSIPKSYPVHKCTSDNTIHGQRQLSSQTFWTSVNTLCLILTILLLLQEISLLITKTSTPYITQDELREYLAYNFIICLVWTLEVLILNLSSLAILCHKQENKIALSFSSFPSSKPILETLELAVSVYFFIDSINLLCAWANPDMEIKDTIFDTLLNLAFFSYRYLVKSTDGETDL